MFYFLYYVVIIANYNMGFYRGRREVLTLQYFGNFKQKEIAKLLKITLENVRILSHRGKIELKKYMEECHEV